jgi:hypothetical protein
MRGAVVEFRPIGECDAREIKRAGSPACQFVK